MVPPAGPDAPVGEDGPAAFGAGVLAAAAADEICPIIEPATSADRTAACDDRLNGPPGETTTSVPAPVVGRPPET